MLLGLFGHGRFHIGAGNIRFGRQGTGIRLGSGFLDTHCRPINSNLDFAGLPLAFRPSLLGVGLVVGPGLALTLLAHHPLGLLFPVAVVHDQFFEVSSQDGVPIYFLLGGLGYGAPTGQRLMFFRCRLIWLT